MLGDVVKLFLCRNCKGLFVLDCQVEKHVRKCNGDAFKSPANLFACEREHFLELVAPSAADEKARVSKRRFRKRRKTSPKAKIHKTETEMCVKSRNTSAKCDTATLSSRSSSEIDTKQFEKTQPNSESISSFSGTSQSQSTVAEVQKYSLYPRSESFSFSASDSALNMDICHAAHFSPPSIVPSMEVANTMSYTSYTLEETHTGFSSNLIRETHKKRSCSESDLEVIQKTSTPATNLLAYLSKLQQGEESSTNQSDDQQETSDNRRSQSATLDNQSSFCTSHREEEEFYIIEDQGLERTDSMRTPVNLCCDSAQVETDDCMNRQHNEEMRIIGENTVQHGDFHFQAVATVSEMQNTETDYFFAGADGTKQCVLRLDEDVPIFPADAHTNADSLTREERVRTSELDNSQVTYSHSSDTSETSVINLVPTTQISLQPDNDSNTDFTSVDLQGNESQAGHSRVKNDEVINLQRESSPGTTLLPSGVAGTHFGGNTDVLSAKENCIQGSVVYILEPNGMLRTVNVEDVFNENGEISSSFALAETEDQVGVSVSDSLSFGVSSDTLSMADLPVESAETFTAVQDGGFVRSDMPSQKAKSKSQIRLDELNALREEVLLQACEIPPDEESKKTHYCCNVCGHIAKSVKFMHNHLQMHSDGKVLFECDQCDFKSRRRSKLVVHQQRHGRSRLLCHLCPATFMDMASLNRHVTAKHTESQHLTCNQCSFSASQASDLKEHMLKHTGELLCCEVEGCGYKTPYLRALRGHQKRHANEKNYKCELCSYETVDKSTLDRHIKSHTQERPYQCSSCNFRANTRHGVLFHMQHIHQQQQQDNGFYYACDKCLFQTTYASSLTKHLQTHQGGYTCPLCSHTCRSVASIKKHVHDAHHLDNVEVIESRTKVKVKDYLRRRMNSEKPVNEELMMSSRVVGVGDSSDELSPSLADLDRSRIDPMKLSFHFHEGPFMSGAAGGGGGGGTGTSLTRSSSIPDLFTFSGMNRSNSQSDLFSFSGGGSISTMTRSNSMSDLVSFATSMCTDSGEPSVVNMDVSLSDATVPPSSLDVVGGLSLGDGPDEEVALSGGRAGKGGVGEVGDPGSPGDIELALQCSKCLGLLMNEAAVNAHSKVCTGALQMM